MTWPSPSNHSPHFVQMAARGMAIAIVMRVAPVSMAGAESTVPLAAVRPLAPVMDSG